MLKPITNINTQNSYKILTGPIQFGTDWPGIFFTLSYIKNLMVSQDIEDIQPVINAFDFSKNYINSFLKEFIEVGSLFENDESSQEIASSIQIIEVDTLMVGDSTVQRVETGIVNINNQIGYFIRGDNAGYLLQLLSIKKDLSLVENQLRGSLSGCIV